MNLQKLIGDSWGKGGHNFLHWDIARAITSSVTRSKNNEYSKFTCQHRLHEMCYAKILALFVYVTISKKRF